MTFTKENLSTIRADLNIALAEVAAKHGITLDIGNISFNENSFTAKLSAAIQEVGQPSMSVKEIKQQQDFKMYAFY